MVNVLVILKENRPMVDCSINEDVTEEEVEVEVESKVEKCPPKQQVLVSLRNIRHLRFSTYKRDK
jgi:hypothetical protein